MKSWYGGLLVVLSVVFFLAGGWLHLRGFWLVCFAAAAAATVVGATSETLRLRSVERDLEEMLERDTPVAEIRAWLMRKSLEPRSGATLGIQSFLVGGFVATAILAFHVVPWTPESTLGHVGRAGTCLALALVVFSVVALPLVALADMPSKIQKRIRASDRASCRVLVAEWEAAADAEMAPRLEAVLEGPEGEAADRAAVEIRKQAATPATGQRAVATLLDELSGPDGRRKARSARALGIIRDAKAIEPLVTTLGDAERDVRVEAARALARLGDSRGLAALLELSPRPDPRFPQEMWVPLLAQAKLILPRERAKGFKWSKLDVSDDTLALLVNLINALEADDEHVQYSAVSALAAIERRAPLAQAIAPILMSLLDRCYGKLTGHTSFWLLYIVSRLDSSLPPREPWLAPVLEAVTEMTHRVRERAAAPGSAREGDVDLAMLALILTSFIQPNERKPLDELKTVVQQRLGTAVMDLLRQRLGAALDRETPAHAPIPDAPGWVDRVRASLQLEGQEAVPFADTSAPVDAITWDGSVALREANALAQVPVTRQAGLARLEALCAQSPASAAPVALLAQALRDTGDFEKATRLLRDALSRVATKSEILDMLGSLHSDVGDHALATLWYILAAYAMTTESSDWGTFVYLSGVYAALDSQDAALACRRVAARMRGGNPVDLTSERRASIAAGILSDSSAREAAESAWSAFLRFKTERWLAS